MTTVTLRFDDQTKKELDEMCEELGMNLTTFFTIYAKKALRERRIPFELDAPVMDTYVVHELNKTDEYAMNHTERLTHEQVFTTLKEKINEQ